MSYAVGHDWQPLVRTGDKTEYGYTPETVKEVEVTEVIYTQLVDDLDLVAVIDAVNRNTNKQP